LKIGVRAISALIQAQGVSDVHRIYGVDFNLVYIGHDFGYPHNKRFDAEYMKRLFDYAYERTGRGYPWHTAPPGEEELAHD